MLQPYLLIAILTLTIALFVWGRWRYDIVALIALVLGLLTGVVPFDRAFEGFANPAVITVAAVMILSYAITESGILDHLIKRLAPATKSPLLHIGSLTLLTALLSAFMNNVGALVLMMPVAIQTSIRAKRSPSMILMPLAFGSVLGGLITAIGTPPNLLISAYRQQITGQPFTMFDFTPVGIAVAIVGILFIIFLGWRLLPERKAPKKAEDLFQIQDYITEVRIEKDSPLINKTLADLESLIEGNLFVVGMIRKRKKRLVIPGDEILQLNDILIVEGNHQDLEKLLQKGKLQLVTGITLDSNLLKSDKIALMEAVVPQASRVENRTAQSMRLRSRHRLNLVAIARQGNPFKDRLTEVKFRAGDVVMLQGEADTLQEETVNLGFLPLVERGVQVGLPRKAYLPAIIFIGAIIVAALQWLPIQIAFFTAVLVLVLCNSIPARKMYEAIDWSIIVMLAALIPVGQAIKSTGAAMLLSHYLLNFTGQIPAFALLIILLFLTMTLSDVMNNAATAVVMAPIAIGLAKALHASVDPFLMAVAIGASCSFLTPISHQNNTLVMGPGGYKFYDYFRVGLPLEILIIIVAVPMILWIWPLH